MKLAAIISVWADTIDLLPHCIDNLLPVVDGVIVMWSAQSNYGQRSDACYLYSVRHHNEKVKFFQHEPQQPGIRSPHDNETGKRNAGLEKSKHLGFTHVIVMDADEFYFQADVESAKPLFNDGDLNSIVCGLDVYFKIPTLYCSDHTLVPFITKLSQKTQVGNFKDFPYAYDSEGHAHIDPTRRFNYTRGVHMSGIKMHHYSHCRRDINMKIENSSARNNLKKSSIYRDLQNAAPGVYNEFYRQNLKECANYFNLPVYE